MSIVTGYVDCMDNVTGYVVGSYMVCRLYR